MAKRIDTEPSAESPVAAPAAAPQEAPKMQPHEWAAKLGHMRKADPRLPQSVDLRSQEYACAAFLHGWDEHLHHYQTEPLLLTQADYEAALEAAGKYPATPAHKPALSPVKRPRS